MRYFIILFLINLNLIAYSKEAINIPYILPKPNTSVDNCENYYQNCLKRPCGYYKFFFWRYYLSEKDIAIQCKTEYNNCINQKYY